MMFWRNLIVLFLMVAFSSSTCEREVDLHLPEPPKKLVIYSTFSNYQDIRVQLNSSRFVLDEAPEEFIAGVNVEIFEEEDFLQQLGFVIPGGRLVPYYSTADLTPEVGKQYVVTASLDGFEPVTAKSSIPSPRPFTELSISDIVIEQIDNRINYQYTINLDFEDIDDQEDFYHLKLYQQIYTHPINGGDDEYVSYIQFPFSDDNDANDILANVSGGLLLEDDPLNGNYSFRVQHDINPTLESLGKVFIELRTVSRDYYQFFSSVTRQQNSPSGILTEPVFIYNNVDGGHGIFAGYSSVLDSLSVID